jgi:hypothetical protein
LAGDEPGVLGGQECDDAGRVGRLADPAEGDAELAAVFCSAVICPNGPDTVLPGPTALTVIRQLTVQAACQACVEPLHPRPLSTTRG